MTSAPPSARVKVPAEAVATLDIPMYRPVEALGTISLMSAQSTARKAPADTANIAAPISAIGRIGATAPMARPTAPSKQEP